MFVIDYVVLLQFYEEIRWVIWPIIAMKRYENRWHSTIPSVLDWRAPKIIYSNIKTNCWTLNKCFWKLRSCYKVGLMSIMLQLFRFPKCLVLAFQRSILRFFYVCSWDMNTRHITYYMWRLSNSKIRNSCSL